MGKMNIESALALAEKFEEIRIEGGNDEMDALLASCYNLAWVKKKARDVEPIGSKYLDEYNKSVCELIDTFYDKIINIKGEK